MTHDAQIAPWNPSRAHSIDCPLTSSEHYHRTLQRIRQTNAYNVNEDARCTLRGDVHARRKLEPERGSTARAGAESHDTFPVTSSGQVSLGAVRHEEDARR